MKLRLRKNSVRLRLTQGDVALFKDSGMVEEHIEFGENSRFFYRLLSDDITTKPEARFDKDGITIIVPSSELQDWATTGRTGIEGEQASPGGVLNILIEKDFTCLEPRPSGEDEDTFPNPLQCG